MLNIICDLFTFLLSLRTFSTITFEMSKPKGEPTALDAYMISKGLKSQSSKARPNLKAYMEKSGCTIDLTGDTVRVVKKPVLMDKSIIDLSSNYDLDLKQPGNSEPRKENVPIPANNLGSPGRSFNYGAYSFDSKARISSYKRGPDLLGTTKIKIGKNDGSDKKAKISAELSAEQKVILHAACELKQSMFFTGRAGTGKSFLLTEMIKVFKERIDDALAVTASAGLAAYNIGGVTLHSFAGLGLGIG